MSWTLESGACPQCQTENSLHIENCHSCGVVLPWAGSEATKTESFSAIGKDVNQGLPSPLVHLSPKVRVGIIMAGAMLFICGAFLWCGNVFGFYPTFNGAGKWTMILGGILFKTGDSL